MQCWLKTHCCLAALLLSFSALSFAQDKPSVAAEHSCQGDDSLVAAARCSKAQETARSKKVVTDDDLQSSVGPLPRLKMNEADNGEEVVAAITKYKQSHTPAETEDVIRRWYEEYDEELQAAITDNAELKTLREANMNNGNGLCQAGTDYEKCQKRRLAEMNGAQHDQDEIKNNNDRIVRIQHSLVSIRNRLLQMGLRYDWFRVRTTNNIDRF